MFPLDFRAQFVDNIGYTRNIFLKCRTDIKIVKIAKLERVSFTISVRMHFARFYIATSSIYDILLLSSLRRNKIYTK